MSRIQPSSATLARAVRSFPTRLFYLPGVQYPPRTTGVEGAVDIHCHAHEGQQDALAVAKFASESRMRGILFKTIVGRPGPVDAVQHVQQELDRWAEKTGITPVACFAGCMPGPGWQVSPAYVQEQLEKGAAAVWLPLITHINTLMKVGGQPAMWDADADPGAYIGPMPEAAARRIGHWLIDDAGGLKPEYREIVRMAADHDAALFFGHATHDEIFLLAEEVQKLGFRRAVIDHPFSPFVDLDVAQMKTLAAAGIYLNFTFDELSPALGIDPGDMCDAIREVGPAQCILSSDAGDALFPNSVECMRLMRGYMEAYGLSRDEVYRMSAVNPAHIVGIQPAPAQVAAAE